MGDLTCVDLAVNLQAALKHNIVRQYILEDLEQKRPVLGLLKSLNYSFNTPYDIPNDLIPVWMTTSLIELYNNIVSVVDSKLFLNDLYVHILTWDILTPADWVEIKFNFLKDLVTTSYDRAVEKETLSQTKGKVFAKHIESIADLCLESANGIIYPTQTWSKEKKAIKNNIDRLMSPKESVKHPCVMAALYTAISVCESQNKIRKQDVSFKKIIEFYSVIDGPEMAAVLLLSNINEFVVNREKELYQYRI